MSDPTRDELADRVDEFARLMYPGDLWPNLEHDDWSRIRSALEPIGITVDRISANMMRRGIKIVAEEIRNDRL